MKLSFLLIPLAFFSCKTVKNSTITNTNQKETIVSINKEQAHNVEISINTKEPYCGGAAPRESDLNKVSVGVFNYLLINTTINDTTTIKSDSLGIIYLNLKVGNYAIREIYKDMPFAQFQKNNQPKANQALIGMDPDCYKKWWLKNLLKFEVSEAANMNTFNTTINKKCRVGKNPCVTFTGQLPR
tara:strand:+ start:9620 stop:10174 length:555 start_codon:yes stop_codon:yes gene_type:complete